MKKLSLVIIKILMISSTGYANTQLCVPHGVNAQFLGNLRGGNIPNSWFLNGPVEMNAYTGTWVVLVDAPFGDGRISGESLCSASPNLPNKSPGQHCWCRITHVRRTGGGMDGVVGETPLAVDGQWVFLSDFVTTANCVSSTGCVGSCRTAGTQSDSRDRFFRVP